MVITYLLGRTVYRIKLFFSDWYIGGFRFVSRRTIDLLESLDRTWALAITFKNIFQPLYQDHTFTGRILGFIFRSIRIVIGIGLYVLIIVAAVIIYAIIAITPLYILYWGFGK
ncbi:MAG: hypothetical protein Q7R62_00720 [bacterium]|nr:hypothetical protein [bacterium]